MDASLDHIRDIESKFELDEEIYQLRRKITLPQCRQPELVDIGKGFFDLEPVDLAARNIFPCW